MPAVALTDECNLFAMVKFYRPRLAAGIKPVIGVDLWLREAGERQEPSRLTLLCQDEDGYHNLSRLVSRAYLEGERQATPLIEREWLTQDSLAGMIALSGGWEGDVGRALLDRPAAIGAPAAQALEQAAAASATTSNCSGLDGHGCRLRQWRRPAGGRVRRARWWPPTMCASCGPRTTMPTRRACASATALLADPARKRRYTREQYLRTPAEMAELFADIPSALANSVEIARRCNLTLKLGTSNLPIFPTPDGCSAEDFLRRSAAAGLARRFAARAGEAAAVPQQYSARLQRELDVIVEMGFAGYFLIVADFIRWARENGVPVGPGRGSGAGSLVA